MKRIKVLICDGHLPFRQGVKAIIRQECRMDVVGEASNGREAVELARVLHPDVILIDIAMPALKGFDGTRRIKRFLPRARVLILTVYDDDDLVTRCLHAGASGYLVKDSPLSEMVSAVDAVARGELYLSPRVLKSMASYYFERPAAAKTPSDLLSPREREVLQMLAGGASRNDVARELHMSLRTVDGYKSSLVRRIHVPRAFVPGVNFREAGWREGTRLGRKPAAAA